MEGSCVDIHVHLRHNSNPRELSYDISLNVVQADCSAPSLAVIILPVQ